MKLNKTVPVAGCTETYIYKNKDCECNIMVNKIEPEFANDNDKQWYFVINGTHSIFAYNSNLDKYMFTSKEECFYIAKKKAIQFYKANYDVKYDNVHYCGIGE